MVTIAKRYIGWGLDFLDLLQEGNIGLMKAIDRFQPARGYHLTTYARWWIRQRILRAIANQSKVIRLPIHILDRRRKVFRAAEELAEELERQPSDTELSLATGETPVFVKQCFNFASTVSLDALLLSDGSGTKTLGDIIPDERIAAPSEGADNNTVAACLEAALRTLTPQEERVLRCRFGFADSGRALTLEEISKEFNVTRERIRQIQNKALQKLRAPSRLRLITGILCV